MKNSNLLGKKSSLFSDQPKIHDKIGCEFKTQKVALTFKIYSLPENPKEVEENEEKIEKDSKETEKKVEVTKVSNRYEALVKASKTVHHKDGDEEDDEDDDEEEEEDCDWEWDYGDGQEDNDQDDKAEEVTSDYIEVDVSPTEEITIPKLSLNPLPPERLIRSSEEREKSSEPPDENEDSETGSYNYVFYVR